LPISAPSEPRCGVPKKIMAEVALSISAYWRSSSCARTRASREIRIASPQYHKVAHLLADYSPEAVTDEYDWTLSAARDGFEID
jgi:hypothetical protein